MGAVQILLCLSVGLACDPQPHTTGYYVSATALGPGNGSECAPFASLDTAVTTALEAGGGTIEVLGTRTDLFELSGVDIYAAVFIRGRGSFVATTGILGIGNMALFEMQGLVIMAGNNTNRGFQVEGQLVLANSTILEFDDAIAVAGGVVVVANTTVEDCNNFITVSSSLGLVNVTRVAFLHNRGNIVFASDEYAKSEVQVLVFSCVFSSNIGEGLIATRMNNPFSASSIYIYGCQFLNNSGLLLSLSGSSINAFIHVCTFTNNQNGAIRIKVAQADITLTDCDWTAHHGQSVEVLQLIGRLVLINVTFREQKSGAPIFLRNSGDVAQCLFVLSNATYSDSNWTAISRNAGFLLMTSCVGSMAGIAIRNVSVSGFILLYSGIIDIETSYAEVRDLSIEDSQSSQVFLYMVFSSVFFVNSRLEHIGAGLNAIVILSLNENISFANLVISGAVALGTSESITVSEGELVFFVSNMNRLVLRGVDIDAGHGSAIVGQFFGSFSAESLTVRNAHIRLSILSTVEATINVSNFHVKNCTSEAVFKANGRIAASVTNVIIESSQLVKVFQCAVLAHCTFTDISISQSVSTILAQVMGASIQLVDIYTYAVTMAFLFRGSAGSQLLISNATVKDCDGGLAELYESQVVVTNSSFDNLKSEKSLISGVRSNITLQTVKMRNVMSESATMADVRDLSRLYVIDSEIRDLSWRNGIILKESHLTVVGTSFVGFPFTLIIGTSATISLSNSHFQSGGPTGTNPLLHGGVLSCEKCESVNMTEITVVSVQSSQGGGVYLSGSVATIARSTFRQCAAINGGAAAIVDSRFDIADSNFIECSASKSGGGIDISSTVPDSEISHSVFSLNRATVGGALNMRKVLPGIRAVRFEWNTAEYGSNTASYTVAARVASTFPTNESYVSGNPFPQNLKIELLDHFNQVVLTDNIAQLSFNLPSNITYGGMTQSVAENGVINLGTAPFYAPPNSTVTVLTSISGNSGSTKYSFEFSWELSFRPCRLGEVKHIDRCELCSAGKFSLSLDNAQCELCPANAYCPGGFGIDLDRGYWRESSNSSEVLICPFSEKCLGGSSSKCEEGYTGKFCSECSEDWYRVGTLYCRQCSLPSAAFQVIAFLIQYFSIFFIAIYISEIKPNETRSAALQIWIDYCQCTSVLLRLRTEQPPVLVYMYHALLYLGSFSASSLPVSCLFNNERSPYLKMLIVTVLPVVALLFFMVLVLFRVVQMTHRRLVRLIGIIFYFIGAPVIESFTALLLSIKLGSGNNRWVFEDASVESWSANHIYKMKYIYSPLFACYILFPLFLLVIALAASRLKRFIAAYCPLFTSGLKGTFFFAQVIIYYWKLLFLLATLSVTARSQLLQVTISLSMLVPVFPAIVGMQIYTSKSLLFLSVGSKVVVFSSVCGAAYYMGRSASDSRSQYFFAPALLALHLLVCGVFAKVFAQGKENRQGGYADQSRSGAVLMQKGSSLVAPEPPPNSVVEWRLEGSQLAPAVQCQVVPAFH